MLSLIAIIGKNRELGRRGQLIFAIPEDMRYFRRVTEGHKVLMGRKTWESLPGKLDERENIVASSGEVEGADIVVHDLKEFVTANKDTEEEIFVIGGGMLYAATLPYANRLYLTEVDAEIVDADTFFPEFDVRDYDREVTGKGEAGDLKYRFVKYSLR